MPWLMAKIYDGFMQASEEACLRRWRAQLLSGVTGRVLEVGAGTGANLPHYSRESVDLVVTEPDVFMRQQLTRKYGDGWPLTVGSDSASRLGYPNASFDVVVATLLLCSVSSQREVLGEIHRVLRPGGRYHFMEHVAAPSGSTRFKWQRRVEPLWKLVADNCHVTRDTESAIRSSGFHIESIERESMRRALPWVRPTIRGVAVKQ